MNKQTKNLILAVIGGLISFFALCLFFDSKYKLGYKPYKFIKIKGNALYMGKTVFNTEHLVGILLGLCIVAFAIAPIIIAEIKKAKTMQCFSIAAAGGIVLLTNVIIFFYNWDEYNASLDDNWYRFFGAVVGFGILAYGLISFLLVRDGKDE